MNANSLQAQEKRKSIENKEKLPWLQKKKIGRLEMKPVQSEKHLSVDTTTTSSVTPKRKADQFSFRNPSAKPGNQDSIRKNLFPQKKN